MTLLNGDCLETLKSIESDSVDSLVTDPPAGISFMGKEWDGDKGGRDGWISWMSEVMTECHRVLKPGAHGLVWALPRTSHWTATALEDAGFEIRDVVTHLFGSGFPKSHDISKAIDRAAGAEREILGPKSTYRKPQISPNSNVCLKREPNETAPSTDSAKQWQGWGTALKPASEHWILVRKPCSEDTVAANVLRWGVGGINIDAGRVPGKLEGDPNRFSKTDGGWAVAKFDNAPIVRTEGRFPANLVLSHSPNCTEDACDLFDCSVRQLDAQSGVSKSTGGRIGNAKGGIAVPKADAIKGDPGFGDTGGASRFFYCAKISSSERNAGLEDMPDVIEQRYANGTKRKLNAYGEDEKNPNHPRKNSHPTVKPKKLMSYFIKLITPPNGVVLDPFMGSGSTGIAAKECGFKFIGIEKEQEYFEIAKARVRA